MTKPEFYTIAEAAQVFGVVPQTIHNWLKAGALSAVRTRGRTKQLVTAASVERLKRKRERGEE